jgi:DNA invertase Pin-like site-specific DNA recombinase
MIAAAYVRKSNDEGAKDASLKSVARQLEGARAFAKEKGWTLDDRYVYEDDAVSGAEFNKRPGLTKLRAALASGPRFKVLIVSEQSRLGRDTGRTIGLIQEIEDAGVEVWSYLNGRRIAADDIQTLVGSWSDSQERQKTVDRIRDAQQQRVQQGRSPGWHAYGYKQVCGKCRGALAVRKTVRVDGAGRERVSRLYICQEHPEVPSTKSIDPVQASVVKRIFKLRAEGLGLYAICRALEADKILNPNDGKTWHNQTVKDILHNQVYTGVRTWRRTMQVRKKGSSTTVETPERVIVDDKNRDRLRIIPDDLWRRAQDINDLARKKSLHDSQGKLTGRVKATASPYLLSPILGCHACGGAMHARRVGKKMYMFCTTRHLHGAKRCPSARMVPMEDAEKEILSQFEEALVGSQVMAMFKTRLDKAKATAEDPDDLKKQIKQLETQKRRLVEAIADGVADSDVKRLLAEKNAQLESLDGRLKGARTVEDFDWAEFVEKAEEVQQHWLASLRKSPVAAQGVMRRLLGPQRIMAKWQGDRWVFLAPPLDYDKVLADTGLVAFTRYLIDTLRADPILSSKQPPPRWHRWPRRSA